MTKIVRRRLSWAAFCVSIVFSLLLAAAASVAAQHTHTQPNAVYSSQDSVQH